MNNFNDKLFVHYSLRVCHPIFCKTKWGIHGIQSYICTLNALRFTLLVCQPHYLFYYELDTVLKCFQICIEPTYSHDDNLTGDFKMSLNKAIKYTLYRALKGNTRGSTRRKKQNSQHQGASSLSVYVVITHVCACLQSSPDCFIQLFTGHLHVAFQRLICLTSPKRNLLSFALSVSLFC